MLTDHQNEYQDIYKYELSGYLFHQVSDLYSLLSELNIARPSQQQLSSLSFQYLSCSTVQ